MWPSTAFKVIEGTKVTEGQNFCKKIKLKEMTMFLTAFIILTQLWPKLDKFTPQSAHGTKVSILKRVLKHKVVSE